MDTKDQQWKEALDEKYRYEEGIRAYNANVFKSIGAPQAELEEILQDIEEISGKIEIVNKPQGDDQEETYDFFTNIYVDQWSMGIRGDSYSGNIYAQYDKAKWLKIPFYC